ncbi:Os04g0648400 [Oryza sativa Japonica Group]|uniref:non-specific serine/threonine protein kinase n=1 Tax=Oryza sativa subsp. japonica TaxID=39947 RepID=A0A0P0WFJ3_ORYSJ|nr:Os04g0648400 [Oryza sativa Japonica Group]
MDIRASLIQANSTLVPRSWGQTEDCCSWERVRCDSSKRRVYQLNLSSMSIADDFFSWELNITVFSAFRDLQFLDLSQNKLISPSFDAFENLTNLQELNLSSNKFEGSIPKSLFSLPHLKVLDLCGNDFIKGGFPVPPEPVLLEVVNLCNTAMNGTLPASAFENLRNLRALNLSKMDWSFNKFHGGLPASLFSLPHLKVLDLSGNFFEGGIPINSSSFPVSLEVLNLNNNNMNGTLPTEQAIENLGNLRELHLSLNRFAGNIPRSLFSLPHIELLDLSGNLLEGPIPISSSSNLPAFIKSLRFSHNNLSGKFSFSWLKNLTKLEAVVLSDNANLAVDVNIPGWVPQFQLKELALSGCDLDKSIITEPHFLRTQHHLEVLDLSNNNLPGSMHDWLFTEGARHYKLDLGNNSLTGSLESTWYTQNFLKYINVSMNRVAGQLPDNINSIFPNLLVLDFSNNEIYGHIPIELCQIRQLRYLDLSNNSISGEVPACLFTDHAVLESLKVSKNKLGGLIFGGMDNMSDSLSYLYLDSNKYEGSIPQNLSAKNLFVMDLHDNKLSGKLDISFWDLPMLVGLNLADNTLTGEIQPYLCNWTSISLLDLSNTTYRSLPIVVGTADICNLQYLRIIDFSHNKLSGSVPACIGNILFGDVHDHDILQIFYVEPFIELYDSHLMSTYYYYLSGFAFSTKGSLYIYGVNLFDLMTGIDLSANMFDGEIPWQLGNLSHIKSLNLSYNFFTGQIPATFSGMKEIESLDLSHNDLSGPIPWQLTQLSSLGAFSVAYNNLSGCIPNYGQLASFSMESYVGNNNLYNTSQGSWCSPSGHVPKEDVEERYDDPVLYIVSAASFVLAFCATVAFSFCHSYGRSAILKM